MIEDAVLPPLDLISASRAGRPWFVFEHAHAIDKIVKPDSEDTTSFSHSRLQHPRTLLWVPERQITAPAKGSELAARFFGGIVRQQMKQAPLSAYSTLYTYAKECR